MTCYFWVKVAGFLDHCVEESHPQTRKPRIGSYVRNELFFCEDTDILGPEL